MSRFGSDAAIIHVHGQEASDLDALFKRMCEAVEEYEGQSAASIYASLCALLSIPADPTFMQHCVSNGTELDLSRSYLGLAGFVCACSVLPLCTNTRTISLQKSRISTPLVRILCIAAGKLRQLVCVDLSSNPFGSMGAQSLISLAYKNPSLVEVSIDYCQIVATFRKKLSQALLWNQSKKRNDVTAEMN
jgi:hypothetical protein